MTEPHKTTFIVRGCGFQVLNEKSVSLQAIVGVSFGAFYG